MHNETSNEASNVTSKNASKKTLHHLPSELDSSLTLSVKNLSYNINQQFLLHEIDLELAPGEVLGVIGPNGAGKSTLLRLLTNDVAKTSGEIVFAGRHLTDWSLQERAKKMAVLPQGTQLDFPFTVEEVVALGRTPHAESVQLSQEIIADVMQQCDVLTLKDHAYTALSGGEQQRVQSARVLAQVWSAEYLPSLLILDEPSTALDFFHQRVLLTIINALAEKKITVILITHDINLACKCATRILGLKKGKAIFEGSVHDVVTETLLSELFSTPIKVIVDPLDGVTPCVVGL